MGDIESEFGKDYQYEGPREPMFGVPRGLDRYGRFPRDHRQMDYRGGVQDRIQRALKLSQDLGIRVEVKGFKDHFEPDEFLDS